MNITKKYQKIPKKIPKIENKKENEYHESYVNVCKHLQTSTKVEVCEYYELCIYLVKAVHMFHYLSDLHQVLSVSSLRKYSRRDG